MILRKISRKGKIMIGISAVAVAVIAMFIATNSYLNRWPADFDRAEPTTAENLSPSPSPVNVTINEETPIPSVEPVSEAKTDSSSNKAEKQVQENVPIPTKPPAPSAKPKATGSDTNSSAPPKYKKQDTVKEPKSATPKQGDKNPKGQMYVEGFGYVDIGSETQVESIDSSGDETKMVGSMD